MITRFRRIVFACCFVGVASCSDGPSTPSGVAPSPVFVRTARLEAHPRTQAFTATPNGEWLVVVESRTAITGDKIRVYDLSLEVEAVAPLDLAGVSAVAASPDGRSVVVVGDGLRPAVFLSLPELSETLRAEPGSGARIVGAADGSAYWVGGRRGIKRISSDGTVLSDTLGIAAVEALDLSLDETRIFVGSTNNIRGESRLDVPRSESLLRGPTIPLRIRPSVIVPLANVFEFVVLGTPSERPFRGPVVSVLVNWSMETVSDIREEVPIDGVVAFGTANPSAQISDGEVLVVTNTAGTLSVNRFTGEVRRLEDTFFEGGPPCCAILYDASHDRIIASEGRGTFEVGGPVIVYERR